MEKNRNKEGVVYTPAHVVKRMLENAGYMGAGILNRHVIDNSCGDGAFLVEIARRYINAWTIEHNLTNNSLESLHQGLETYIHGIEIDPEAAKKCVENLDKVVAESHAGWRKTNWDIRVCDALECHDFDGKMDFVIGNPPYIRVHNIKGTKTYDTLKQYEFTQCGSTDIYLAFYELGFRMLKDGMSVLSYIAPSGWLKGPAGKKMREYVGEHHNLSQFVDLGEAKIFEGMSPYVAITLFNNYDNDDIEYYEVKDFDSWGYTADSFIRYEDAFINGDLYLGTGKEMDIVECVEKYDGEKFIKVKNGYATLLDDFFIYDESRFPDMEIPVTKASTGERKFCFYPYDTLGFIYTIFIVRRRNREAFDYMWENKSRLESRSYDSEWYGFGRKQGITDTYRSKIAVNNVIKDIKDIKISFVPAGEGVYSGQYIIFNDESRWIQTYTDIVRALCSDEFIKYVKALKKHKSGGYYTFTTKHLEKYLNWKLGTKEN